MRARKQLKQLKIKTNSNQPWIQRENKLENQNPESVFKQNITIKKWQTKKGPSLKQ